MQKWIEAHLNGNWKVILLIIIATEGPNIINVQNFLITLSRSNLHLTAKWLLDFGKVFKRSGRKNELSSFTPTSKKNLLAGVMWNFDLYMLIFKKVFYSEIKILYLYSSDPWLTNKFYFCLCLHCFLIGSKQSICAQDNQYLQFPTVFNEWLDKIK